MAAKKKAAPKKPARGGKRKVKPTRDETVEVETGVQLLLGNSPPARDTLYHYQNILGLTEKSRTASAKVSDAKKKATEAGVDVRGLMNVMRLSRVDPLDLATELKTQAMMMHELGMPIQISLFEPKYGSIEEQATAEGKAAGENGRTPDLARWPEGTPGHEAYHRAWNDGQKNIIMGGKKDEGDEAEAEAEGDADE